MTQEIEWKNITKISGKMADKLRLHEFMDYYEVSNIGTARNIQRGKEMSLEEGKDGYFRVAMRVKNGKTRNSTRKIHIHKLVALCFIGEPTDVKMQADHIDRNPANNNVKNLRWLTSSENCLNRSRSGRQKKGGTFWFDGYTIYVRENDFNKFCRNKETAVKYTYQSYMERLSIENSIEIKDEKWKTIEIENRSFQVSDRGRVYLEYYRKNTFGTPCKSGYFNVTQKGKTHRVHRLIALAFFNKDDTKGLVVNHKDNYGFNNNVDNLEWITVSENLKHAFKVGAKKTRRIVRKSYEGEVKEYESIRSAIEELGGDENTRKSVEACLRANAKKENATYSSKGYIWYYA